MRKKWKMICAFCNNEKFTNTLKKEKNYCDTVCFNKHTKNKNITGYKKCLNCTKEFPFRESLNKRSYKTIKAKNSKFCCFDCSIFWKNKYDNPTKREDVKKKISEYAKKRGTQHMHTKEAREKQRKSISKQGHWNWQGGITKESKSIRNSFEYKQWRTSVYERDNYTCQKCFVRGTTLNAHHIKSFSRHNDLRLNIENGITLCIKCHKETDSYGGKKYY